MSKVRRKERFVGVGVVVGLCLVLLLITAGEVLALGTPAGTRIINRAVIQFTGPNGESFNPVQSNEVVVVVSSLFGVPDLQPGTQDNDYIAYTKDAVAGSPVYFSHSIVNTGNDADTIAIAAQFDTTFKKANGESMTPEELDRWRADSTSSPKIDAYIYSDPNGNGRLDPGETQVITSTGALAADGIFNFIVVVNVPGDASASVEQTKLIVTATSGGDPTKQKSVYDITKVISGPVVTSTLGVQALTVYQGSEVPVDDPSIPQQEQRAADKVKPGETVLYTITYTNTGTDTAHNLYIGTTAIPVGGSGAYLPGTTYHKIGNALPVQLDDINGQSPLVADNNGKGIFVGDLAPGATGQIMVKAVINQDVAAGALIKHRAIIQYTELGPGILMYTNYAVATVLQVAGWTFNPAQEIPQQGAFLEAPAGGYKWYTHQITNTGNGNDIGNLYIYEYDDVNQQVIDADGNSENGITPLSVSGSARTSDNWTITIFKGDGIQTVIDHNADGIVDTGNLVKGGAYTVKIKIESPLTAPEGGKKAFKIVVKSVFDTNYSEKFAFDTLKIKTNFGVQFTGPNSAGGYAGDVLSLSYRIRNTGESNDSYWVYISDYAYKDELAMLGQFTVVWYRDTNNDGSLQPGEPQLSPDGSANPCWTGSVPPGGNYFIIARVMIPADAVYLDPGDPSSGYNSERDLHKMTVWAVSRGGNANFNQNPAQNIMLVGEGLKGSVETTIGILPIYDFSMFGGGTSTATTGRMVVYSHTIVNDGNAPDGYALSASSSCGWTWNFYVDIDNNGIFDPVWDKYYYWYWRYYYWGWYRWIRPFDIHPIDNDLSTYIDKNNNGVYDEGTDVDIKDDEVHFLAVCSVPTWAKPGDRDVLTITARSYHNSALTRTNQDVTVFDAPAIKLVKSLGGLGADHVKPGDIITYNVDIYNYGNQPAKNAILTDFVPQFTNYEVASMYVLLDDNDGNQTPPSEYLLNIDDDDNDNNGGTGYEYTLGYSYHDDNGILKNDTVSVRGHRDGSELQIEFDKIPRGYHATFTFKVKVQ